MLHARCPIVENRVVGPNMYTIGFRSLAIASTVCPGQFVNLKVGDFDGPLLRRPFSIYRVDGEILEIIFNVVGKGTAMLANKRPGEQIDVIGPLGTSFTVTGEFRTALLVGGGLGVAPFPLLTVGLERRKIQIVTYLGAQTRSQLVPIRLKNVRIATDDGSAGFRGTVVDLLRSELKKHESEGPKLFGCGPNAMLRALSLLARERGIACEVSLESAMACGVGICQGCPVERVGGQSKYALVCTDGPVFDARTVKLG